VHDRLFHRGYVQMVGEDYVAVDDQARWPDHDGEQVRDIGDQISVNGRRVQRGAYCFIKPEDAASNEYAERGENAAGLNAIR
jgi:hypothetical protein